MEREELCRQLAGEDEALFFIVVILAGIALSWRAAAAQRDGLCRAIRGEAADTPEVYPLRHAANSLVVGALGFFLCLAVRAWSEADRNDPAAVRSANANLWASMLVLAAALIRYQDVERGQVCP